MSFVEIDIHGIDYGFSLYYSYTLPLYDVKPIGNGFIFEKAIGFCKGIRCRFYRDNLKTTCIVPNSCVDYIDHILGLDSKWGFEEICRVYSDKDCIASRITLLYSPKDPRYILYAILLSRNTDYFINSIKWFREFITFNTIRNRGYIANQFLTIRDTVDDIFNKAKNASELINMLFNVRYIGLKTISALLLHAYGATEYAPIDRHYKAYLSTLFKHLEAPQKKTCVSNNLNCSTCLYRARCIYGVSKMFGKLNGYIQSLAYLSKRISICRSTLEETLIPKSYRDAKTLSNIVSTVIERLLHRDNQIFFSQYLGHQK